MTNWSGIALPVIKERGGYFYPRDELDLVWSSMVTILGTPLKTRLMLPEFGSILPQLVFEPNDTILRLQIEKYSGQAIRRWEPRVTVHNMEVLIQEEAIQLRITFSTKTNPDAVTRGFVVKRFQSFQVLRQLWE